MRIILIYDLIMNKGILIKTFIISMLVSSTLFAGDLGLQSIDVTAPISKYSNSYSVTATKTNTKLIDLPQSVNVINQEQLKDQQATSLGQSITYAPGIDLDQGEGNRDAFIIRGNKTTADIFLDGVKDDAEYYRDLYNIERVDVLMGANGILFGKGGSGGIVNRVSKQALFSDINNCDDVMRPLYIWSLKTVIQALLDPEIFAQLMDDSQVDNRIVAYVLDKVCSNENEKFALGEVLTVEAKDKLKLMHEEMSHYDMDASMV
ncbi:MAG: hypothetical protein EBW04_01605 [Betaproteobacteria bacterium]|nr:hypothetical protein [Betaproteobacteria bacterium]